MRNGMFCAQGSASRRDKKDIVMNKPARKHTGRSVSRRHATRGTSRKTTKSIGGDDFYRHAAEVDRILELEFADDDPDGIRLAHK